MLEKLLTELKEINPYNSRLLIDWFIRAFNRGWQDFDGMDRDKFATYVADRLPREANEALAKRPPNLEPHDPAFADWLLTLASTAMTSKEPSRSLLRDKFLEYAGFFFER